MACSGTLADAGCTTRLVRDYSGDRCIGHIVGVTGDSAQRVAYRRAATPRRP